MKDTLLALAGKYMILSARTVPPASWIAIGRSRRMLAVATSMVSDGLMFSAAYQVYGVERKSTSSSGTENF